MTLVPTDEPRQHPADRLDGTHVVAEPDVDDKERARRIRTAVRARSAELHDRHPILRHQSAIGATILVAAAIGVIGTGVLYVAGTIAWWVAIPVAAFFMSLAHEIEHDTIHRLYFTRNKRTQDVMLAVGWLLRPYTINPWIRRELHLLHHKVSGTEQDIEERAITNGVRWSPKRLLMMVDPLAAAAFRVKDYRAVRTFYVKSVAKAYFPLTFVALAIWYSFLAVHVAGFLGLALGGPVVSLIDVLAVVWLAPNVLRVACLHFISSNMHYYGDVELGNIVQQTQVLNRWWLAPMQAFCCNFGSTHGIHHFVPGEPFYVRQMTAKVAHQVMRANGVRFNDLGTFARANRYAR